MDTQEKNTIYQFPPLSLLKKGELTKYDAELLKETALMIQQTLQNFGIRVTLTDIVVGARFTRYEIQPAQGVRIKDITCLENEIRIDTAAKSIHIEAPIQGKAAIGIDIPNESNNVVTIREILESDTFQRFPSNLAFAVGRGITGNYVVTDIAKMSHLLIAGTTGSGKTVCIDTIIMSILYKANPADVKLIMIDTKMMNMSVYNGIPHLMIPVVTDAKKACAALNWAVTEMNDRYKKFADIGVRDLKGYNKSAEMGLKSPDGDFLTKLPQILVIIDDLYDMIMANTKEVRESIIRLTQLARATGIHLVISTQRPSVDIVAGLIKTNIPSRIAFTTVSAIDSRVILDESGAEKLLGNGDMLFKPRGYIKPVRVQGAYVSDAEVSDVVDFLKNQMLGNVVNREDIAERIRAMQSETNKSLEFGDFDAYIIEAGKFVIEKDKASIGMLQRAFKIGFNRAAQIVDQLEELGVIGAEQGTKPCRILMTMEEFQVLLENNFDSTIRKNPEKILDKPSKNISIAKNGKQENKSSNTSKIESVSEQTEKTESLKSRACELEKKKLLKKDTKSEKEIIESDTGAEEDFESVLQYTENYKNDTIQNNDATDSAEQDIRIELDKRTKRKLKFLLCVIIVMLFMGQQWILGFVGIVAFVIGNRIHCNKEYIKEHGFKQFIYVGIFKKYKSDKNKIDKK